MSHSIIGKIIDVIYVSLDNEYGVALFLSQEDDEITITGSLAGLDIGDKIQITGNYTKHRIYGEQFKVESYVPLKPDSIEEIYDFLSSGVIDGVGEKYAKKIIDVFQEKTLEVIEKTPEKLLQIDGIGTKKLDKIITSYHEKMNLKNVIIQLSKFDLSTSLSIKIYNTYLENTVNVLMNNPYKLCEDIKGIGFIKADEIARKIGIADNLEERKIQAALYILNQSVYEGHTYINLSKLSFEMKKLINLDDEEEILSVCYDLYTQKQIIIDGSMDERDKIKIYLYSYAMAETNVASKLIELLTYQDEVIEQSKLNEIVSEKIKYSKIQLSEEQIESVYMAVNNNILILTGGPGTGKTTTLSFIIDVFEAIGKKIKLCAPTGKASKRMTQSTKKEASTIHRLLDMGYNSSLEEEFFGKNEDEPISADVIIVDETSMVDILLMNNLLSAIKKGTRLILVGDKDQLPSVGAGNVLKDIIDSSLIPCITLSKIFRQAMKSNIIVNAHRINSGLMPLANQKENDFFIMSRENAQDIQDLIVDLITKRLPEHYNITKSDIQIITPMKKRDIGTQNLNKILQNALNPKSPLKNEYETKFRIYREDDRVIHVKNDYEKKWIDESKMEGSGIFNGDTGVIQSVNVSDKILTVLFDDGKKAVYNFDELGELEHAFALTIHKSQGSEYPCIILPIHHTAPMLLTRKILYTAITRAKKLLVIVATQNTIRKMVDNIFEEERNSTLKEKLLMFKELLTSDDSDDEDKIDTESTLSVD